MHEPLAITNLAIILVTVVVSLLAFRNPEIEERGIFYPEAILAGKQYYRLLTAALLHADWGHLLMNMLSLYLFGNVVEFFVGPARYLLIYFGAVCGCNRLSLYIHRHHDYRAYGASGGVYGMIFAHMFLFPWVGIYIAFVPFAIPAWLYAIALLVYSFRGMKQEKDNIGHDAHLGGALAGLMVAA